MGGGLEIVPEYQKEILTQREPVPVLGETEYSDLSCSWYGTVLEADGHALGKDGAVLDHVLVLVSDDQGLVLMVSRIPTANQRRIFSCWV